MTFDKQWLEALALAIEQNYIHETETELSTVVEQIVSFIRKWDK
jgi:hypothetical protein